jgi:hypothetical protein
MKDMPIKTLLVKTKCEENSSEEKRVKHPFVFELPH